MKRKFTLQKNFNNKDFFNLIDKCLKSNYDFTNLKKSFDNQSNKYETDIIEGWYHLTVTGQDDNVFFKLSQRNSRNCAEDTITIILEKNNDERSLYVSYEVSEGSIEYDKIPNFVTNILRVISNNIDENDSSLGKTGSAIYANENNKEEIVSRINGNSEGIPMVFASEYHGYKGYEIDGETLARKLTCFAYVVLADFDFMTSIKDKIQRKTYNGTVTVFAKRKHESFRKEDMKLGPNFEKLAFNYVKSFTQNIEMPTLVQIRNVSTVKAPENKSSKELTEENQELRKQLEEANQKVKNLEKALEQAKDEKFGIILPKEIYEGEVLDLISCAVEDYIQNADDVQTRIKQLGKKILDLNPRGTNGKEFFEKVYSIVSKDGNLNSVQKSQLKALGFQETRKNGHYIFEIEGIPFTFSSSSSDFRNGKKINNTIKRTLCVYR